MKNKKFALLLLSASALALGLAACGGNGESSSPVDPGTSSNVPSSEPSSSEQSSEESSSEESSSQANPATRIQRETIPSAVVNQVIDLDEYITIEYRDGTTDKTYDVTSSSETLTIDGHKISSSVAGTANITITAGTVTARINVTFLSALHKELIDFMAPLDADPLNFTADWYNPDNSGTPEFYLSHYSWEGASIQVDLSDLDKLDMWGEDTVNSALAELSDGNAYWGSVIEGATAGTYDLEFEPGKSSMSDWIRGYGISVDTTAFTEQSATLSDGSTLTYLLSDATFAEALCEGASGSRWTFGGGYKYYGAAYYGLTDTDKDGVGDAAQFDILIWDGTNASSAEGVFTFVLSDLGTTSLDWVKAAQQDEAHIPVVLTGSEIATSFAAVAEAGNYTVTASLLQLNSSGSAIKSTVESGDYIALAYGCNQVQITNTYTEDGVISRMLGTPVTFDETTGAATVGAAALQSGWAAWDDDSKSYYTSYDDETVAWATATEITSSGESVANVYEGYLNGRGYTAGAVTSAGVANTNWSSRTENEDGTITYAGDCGDNDGETATNLFLKQLLDILGPYNGGMGTYWTSPVSFTSGNHALCLYSDFNAVTVNPTTNEISVTIVMYAPFSGVTGNYFLISMRVSNIGTTTNDFSGFTLPGAGEVVA